MSSTWKPCDSLVPSDFAKHPVWTFDLRRGETDPKANETWVRPLGHRGFDRTDDELFVKAKVVDRDGKELPNCVICVRLKQWDIKSRRQKSGPAVTALVLLSPKYIAVRIQKDRLGDNAPPTLQRRLPLTYEIDVSLGERKRLSLTGSIGSSR